MNADQLLDLAGAILLGVGSLAMIVGAVGLLRFPDVFSRRHAGGVTDSLGAGSILIGLMLIGASWATLVKLCMVLFFLFVTSPTSAHALSRAALYAGVRPLLAEQTAGKREETSRPAPSDSGEEPASRPEVLS